jgi:hypothetical protein
MADTLRDFLVKIKYESDGNSLNTALGGVNRVASGLMSLAKIGGVATVAALTLTRSYAKAASEVSWSVQRMGISSIKNFNALNLAAKQTGGSVDDMTSSLKNAASVARRNPSGALDLARTEGADVKLTDSTDVRMEKIAKAFQAQIERASKVSELVKQETISRLLLVSDYLGYSEDTALSMMDKNFNVKEDHAKQLQRNGNQDAVGMAARKNEEAADNLKLAGESKLSESMQSVIEAETKLMEQVTDLVDKSNPDLIAGLSALTLVVGGAALLGGLAAIAKIGGGLLSVTGSLLRLPLAITAAIARGVGTASGMGGAVGLVGKLVRGAGIAGAATVGVDLLSTAITKVREHKAGLTSDEQFNSDPATSWSALGSTIANYAKDITGIDFKKSAEAAKQAWDTSETKKYKEQVDKDLADSTARHKESSTTVQGAWSEAWDKAKVVGTSAAKAFGIEFDKSLADNGKKLSSWLSDIVTSGTQAAKEGLTTYGETGSFKGNTRLPKGSKKEDLALAHELFPKLEKKYGLRAGTMSGIWAAESSMGANVSTPLSSAKGHFQIIDGTAKHLGLALNDRYDLAKSSDAAARLLHEELVRFNGDQDKALAAYKIGGGAMQKAARRGISPNAAVGMGQNPDANYLNKVKAHAGDVDRLFKSANITPVGNRTDPATTSTPHNTTNTTNITNHTQVTTNNPEVGKGIVREQHNLAAKAASGVVGVR